jgi:hypothetical protein
MNLIKTLDNKLPFCAVCKKPVEKLTSHRNEQTLTDVYFAECHGDVQEVKLPLFMYLDDISMGEAFAEPKLLGRDM